ncbi:MAG: hypothetical protein JWO98_2460 [Frankiales bacterium]|nr:hypothetical protein [Frankiales bacterium]
MAVHRPRARRDRDERLKARWFCFACHCAAYSSGFDSLARAADAARRHVEYRAQEDTWTWDGPNRRWIKPAAPLDTPGVTE